MDVFVFAIWASFKPRPAAHPTCKHILWLQTVCRPGFERGPYGKNIHTDCVSASAIFRTWAHPHLQTVCPGPGTKAHTYSATAMGASSSFLDHADMCCRADDEEYDMDRILVSKRHLYDGQFGASTSTVYSSASTCAAGEVEQGKQYLKRPIVISDEGYRPIWVA